MQGPTGEQFIRSLEMAPKGTTPADVTDDGIVVQVPNKAVARLLQLGVAASREQQRRVDRRRQQRLSRRRNRSK